jgi:hypothetical protein
MLKFADSGELDNARDKLNPSVDCRVVFLQHGDSRLPLGDSSCLGFTCLVGCLPAY